ncbi:craniofacial development protein 2-like [Drosophila santomea]|uniref:craniofacial development protein 2-like n=1 Tax=Drosophila santomea TaxID=129105 RepID=UPI001CCD1675|nr:craniofacial development protein 2-like [Drosophila santomea]
MTARFRCRARHINIIQCYAPTEDAKDDTKDDFYTALTATLSKTRQGDINILMGDFDAKVGPNNTGLRSVMGQHGTGTRNDNEERLVELCQLFQLVIGGTIFPHKDVHKYSWTSSSGSTRNQIDHICISRKWRHSLLDVDSDHELPTPKSAPLNLLLLSACTLRTRMTSTLREQLIPLEEHPWERTYSQLRTAAEKIIGLQRGRADWIYEGTWDLIRRRSNQKPLADQLTQNRDEYRELCRAVKRAARKDNRDLRQTQNNMRSLYQQIARITGTHHRRNQQVRILEGNLLSNDDAQIRRWRQHFMGISHTTSPNVAPDYRSIAPPSGNIRIPSTRPHVRETVNAIKKLKRNRAAGEDNIPAKLLQVDT